MLASLAAVGSAFVAATAGIASAAEPSTLPAVPFGFSVPATNGWTAEVFGAENPKTRQPSVGFRFARRDESAVYVTTRVAFTETTVTADFGALGNIEVHSVPTGGTTSERPSCGGKSVTFPAGKWEGTIRFRGEEGFTAVEASAGTAAVGALLDLLCAGEVNEGTSGHSPGALFTLRRRQGAEALELSARNNRRVGPARFSIDLSEARGHLFIDRSVKAEGREPHLQLRNPAGARDDRAAQALLGIARVRASRRVEAKAERRSHGQLPGPRQCPGPGPRQGARKLGACRAQSVAPF